MHSAEIGGRTCLSSGILFFRHVTLWALGQAGKVKVPENAGSFSEIHYSNMPWDYNEGPDLAWNEKFT